MDKTISTGNYGPNIRSDCQIDLLIKNSGGIRVEIASKVKSLFGKKIEWLIKDVLDTFRIEHARVKIHDSGALDFVIAARMEAAVTALLDTDTEYLLPIHEDLDQEVSRDRRKYTRLYVPGNTPRMMINAGIHRPDGVILDLEDSVAQEKKKEARLLVRNALRQVNFYGSERMVRINQLPEGIEDLKYLVPHHVQLILIPKCEEADQISQVNKEIDQLPDSGKKSSDILLMPIIETALGIENAFSIARAADNIIGLAIGLEDLTADLGIVRTREGAETLYARTRLVNACKAAGIHAIDSVYSDVSDTEGLQAAALLSKALGFSGMGCIHPRQIQVIEQAYLPDSEEIEKALAIVKAYDLARTAGSGVVALGSKMIDAPVVKRALHIIEEAQKAGLISNTEDDTHD